MRTSLFGRGGSSPGRVTLRDAALRTRHATGRDGDAPPIDVREPRECRAGHARMPLAALATGAGLPAVVTRRSGSRSRRAAELPLTVGAIGGIRDRATAGLPAADAHGGDGTVA
ncbi:MULTISPECIES: rhodanese-like domain-containing protein [Streptomyces]|uniref:rhodanese-like domain-containing protein n=1 Tax=Streptomyces TaxID=1883 RepID=UPI001E2AC7D8|nr:MULTISPECIES: rhodanese-like domain-containing protein [Streptomyces]